MKTKMSMKQAHAGARKVYAAGYCSMQCLLNYKEPFAYNAGLYGWNNDSYLIFTKRGAVVISTGYRNMQGAHIDYDTMEKYEKQAEKIVHDRTLDYDEKVEKVNALLVAMFDEIENS